MILHRYWMTFDLLPPEVPKVLLLGCGVTASCQQQALEIVKKNVFRNTDLPAIKTMQEDVDISTLDQGHILPNIGNIFQQGVWFPLGYQ